MRGWVIVVVILGALVALVPWIQRQLPPSYDPFSPLSIDDPPTFITWLKMKSVANDPEACLAVLKQAQESGRLSEHATADAWDIAAFRLSDGRQISVLNQWSEADDRGSYLRNTFRESCRFFGNSLGPEYNAAHANHFHFGMRGFGVCR
ncbi:extensin family protein [Pectobacterium versatile]|uniref:extensin-like domain-containing protein n=1 Tax=Pectobacterium versatile TaxID=2488639 RepID=UPI001CCE7183|nr:extensin family protein [Pectobacterium versatile]